MSENTVWVDGEKLSEDEFVVHPYTSEPIRYSRFRWFWLGLLRRERPLYRLVPLMSLELKAPPTAGTALVWVHSAVSQASSERAEP